jgi:hypothetical protein
MGAIMFRHQPLLLPKTALKQKSSRHDDVFMPHGDSEGKRSREIRGCSSRN